MIFLVMRVKFNFISLIFHETEYEYIYKYLYIKTIYTIYMYSFLYWFSNYQVQAGLSIS